MQSALGMVWQNTAAYFNPPIIAVMSYTSDFIENITYAGKMGLKPYEIKYSFKIENFEKFLADFNEEGSEINEAYKKGVGSAQFEIEKSLIKQAELGDKESIELLWKIQTKREAMRERDPNNLGQ